MVKHTRYALLSSLVLAGSGAIAYTLSEWRWFEPHTTIYVGIRGSSPSGTTWSSALRSAMDDWTRATAFDFHAEPGYLNPCAGLRRNDSNGGVGLPLGNGDRSNGTDFGTTVCGNNFGEGVLAITISFAQAGPLGFPVLEQTDIIFNSNFEWDVYSGPLQQRIDFRRVALHELGHALGLDHSSATQSIMQPNYGSLHTLQADDVSGVNALYDHQNCEMQDLAESALIRDRLSDDDCRVLDLFPGADDTSFIDLYRLKLARETQLDISVTSSEIDPVLIIANANFSGVEIIDDTDGGCDARVRKRFPAGEYRILVNTYVEPEKCAGNVGTYNLTVSNTGLPSLGNVRSLGGTGQALPKAVFTGGATSDAGTSFPSSFGPDQGIDIIASITPDPAHVGRAGRVFTIAELSDGRLFAQDANGTFRAFSGDFATLEPRRTGTLRSPERLPVVFGLRGTTSGLAGQTISVYVGYALDSNPSEIWYGSSPIRFSISSQ
ncbi:MAG: matrixin family metalloprotease [Pseudomonadota bacterium]|nr:matrixin family metalloprotease [Pseudomonadota bacterium]